jgi:hypothetical protein
MRLVMAAAFTVRGKTVNWFAAAGKFSWLVRQQHFVIGCGVVP